MIDAIRNPPIHALRAARLALAALAIALLPALLAPNTAVGQDASENFIPPKPIDLAVELIPEAFVGSVDWGLDVTNNSDVPISDVKVRIDTGTQPVKLYPHTRFRNQPTLRIAPPRVGLSPAEY